MKTFAERLKLALDKIGISQAEAARRCGISQQAINYIISNNLKQSKLAVAIASALDINPNWLIYGEGKFKETKCYEIPVFDNAYKILKYINNDVDESSTAFILVDMYLGDLAFAYLVSSNKLAICSQKKYNIQPMEYLCITASSAVIHKTPITDLFFNIIEWRIRGADFQFS